MIVSRDKLCNEYLSCLRKVLHVVTIVKLSMSTRVILAKHSYVTYIWNGVWRPAEWKHINKPEKNQIGPATKLESVLLSVPTVSI